MKNRADTKKHLQALLDGLCIAGAVLAPFFLGIIFVMIILHNLLMCDKEVIEV